MTQEIQHHLSPQILMAYAAGALPEAFNLIVATHLSLCDQCRAEAESYDALGGAVLEAEPDAVMSEGSFEAVMARIAAGDGPVPKARRAKDRVLPAPLHDYVGGGLADVKWRPLGRGLKQAILPTTDSASARLLYIPAGMAMPRHGHSDIEMTLVLQGAFQDEGGYFARGDIEIADSETEHTPVADSHEDCICLAASNAPLKFRSLLPRLAQPFLKI